MGRADIHVYGLGLLYEETGVNTKTYHYERLGSTVALTDGSQNVSDRWDYAPFGATAQSASSTNTPFRWHGELGVQTDPNGLHYMRARYYNPRLMRFVNADPIGFAGGMNWYAFAGNDPVSRSDPSGLWFGIDDAVFAGAGAVIGVGGKLLANFVTNTPTTWQDVVGAAVGSEPTSQP